MQLIRSRKFMAGLALAAALTVAGVGFAQQTGQGQGDNDHAGRRWNRDGEQGEREHGPFAKLNLTDAQKQQMQQIEERYRQTFKSQRQHEGSERRGFDPLGGGTFDEAAVRAAAQARANAEVEREVAHARMMFEMYNVLTPEQKAQLAAERQQREQKRQEWRSRRQANPGQTQQ
jgi:periplasmic protein CpxP/Spy